MSLSLKAPELNDLMTFLNSFEKKKVDIEKIEDYFELIEHWKRAPMFSELKMRIDNRMFELLPDLLEGLPKDRDSLFTELDKILETVTSGSKSCHFIKNYLKNFLIEEREECQKKSYIKFLSVWRSRWKNGGLILGLIEEEIGENLSKLDVKELLVLREDCESIHDLIDRAIACVFPQHVNSLMIEDLIFILQMFVYPCRVKELAQNRVFHLMKEDNEFIKVMSFDEKYNYWKLFDYNSLAAQYVEQFIKEDLSLEEEKKDKDILLIWIERLKGVRRFDSVIRSAILKKISDHLNNLKLEDISLVISLIQGQLKNGDLPEEVLIPLKNAAIKIYERKV